MDKNYFLNLDEDNKSKFLVNMAYEATTVLNDYRHVFKVATDAVGLLESHLVNPLPPKEIGLYLEHYDESKDIGSLYGYVRDDNLAISAIDIIAYATGAIALSAYHSHGIYKGITDPILEATPDVFEFALTQYKKLEIANSVRPVSEVWSEIN